MTTDSHPSGHTVAAAPDRIIVHGLVVETWAADIATFALINELASAVRISVQKTDIIDAVSKLYETAPVGGPDEQGPYLNAALVATTTLEAAELLALMHRIEALRERERIVHWGPRTLDLDLLVYGDLVWDVPSLHVPHPRQHERRFVLVPVCDVAPGLVHPLLGQTMRELLDELPVEPGDLTAIDDNRHLSQEVSP